MEKKLPEDFKKKWCEALRSEKYKQCRGSLACGKTYCCIGVAIIVHTNNLNVLINKESYSSLPEAISGGFSNPIAEKLVYMNDQECKSFSEIAD